MKYTTMIEFLGIFKTVKSKMNSNTIVVKLWYCSNALQIPRNGLDCQTNGLMIYKIPIYAPEKNEIQEVCVQDTTELQYANKIDSVPS